MKIKQHYNLTNCNIAIFSPTLFMLGQSFKKFRNVFLNEFSYIDGFQIKASHFANCESNWGISFTIWESGECENKDEFNVIICDKDEHNNVIEIQDKTLYNLDNKTIVTDWAEIKSKDMVSVVPMTSAIKMGNNDKAKMINGSMGCLAIGQNNIEKNAQLIALMSTRFNHPGTRCLSILPENFLRCTALFTARRTIQGNWMNSKDEYIAPDTTNPIYPEFEADSIVYSLFDSASNQSSLRDVNYRDKTWQIKNEFFWMSRDEMTDLTEEFDNEELYNDIRANGNDERYVYKLLYEQGYYDKLYKRI